MFDCMISLIQRNVSVAADAKNGRQARKENKVFFMFLIVFGYCYWFLARIHLRHLQDKQENGCNDDLK